MSLLGDIFGEQISTIELPIAQAKADKNKESIGTIAKTLSSEELELLAKAVKNPILKAQAISKLKEYV